MLLCSAVQKANPGLVVQNRVSDEFFNKHISCWVLGRLRLTQGQNRGLDILILSTWINASVYMKEDLNKIKSLKQVWKIPCPAIWPQTSFWLWFTRQIVPDFDYIKLSIHLLRY